MTTANIIEIFCILDDVLLSKTKNSASILPKVEKTYLPGAGQASPQPSQPDVGQRDHDQTRAVPHEPLPRLKVILPGLCLPTHAQGLFPSRIL